MSRTLDARRSRPGSGDATNPSRASAHYLLAGWIVAQIALIRLFYAPLHLPDLGLGLLLATLGVVLDRRRAPGASA